MSEPVYVNIKCRVASEWCINCVEMDLEHDKNVLRFKENGKDAWLITNRAVCKNLYKCLNILDAKRRFEDEQDT